MNFYSHFPMIRYNGILVTDLFKRFTISEELLQNAAFYEHYIVQEGETPEILAARFYGSSRYAWVLLLANNIRNPYYDWVLSDQELYAYVQRKYGVGKEYAIHHYEAAGDAEIEDGTWVTQNFANKVSVSNLQHETNVNEAKRKIKVLMPNAVNRLDVALKEYFKTTNPTV